MWGLMTDASTRYRFVPSYPRPGWLSRPFGARKRLQVVTTKSPSSFDLPGPLPEAAAQSSKGLKIRPDVEGVQTEHLLRVFFHQLLTARAKLPVEKRCRASWPRSLRVFIERGGEAAVEVDAQVVGEEDDDEEDITELIHNRTRLVLRRPSLVAELKVQLAAQLADFLGQAGILRQRRPVAAPLLDPGIDERLHAGKVRWDRPVASHCQRDGRCWCSVSAS